MELGKVDHHARQEGLTGALRRLAEASRQPEGDRCVAFPDLHGRRQAQHVVDGGLHQTNGAGNCRTDNVLAGLSVAAVALHVESDDAAPLALEGDGGHAQTEILPISTLV